MYLISRIGKKYTIYLPKSVVKALNLSEGERIIIKVEDDSIIIKPIRGFFRKKEYWSTTSFKEIEDESEEITKLAEEED